MQPVASIWYGVDPLAEKYANVSGYTYCLGNPIRLMDPDGNEPKAWIRIWGAAQMVGGSFEAVVGGVGGVATSETGIGAVVGYAILANGIDNAVTGAKQLWTGEEQETILHKSVETMTTSMGIDKNTSMAIMVAIDISSGNFKSPQKARKIINHANSLLRNSRNFRVASKYGFGS